MDSSSLSWATNRSENDSVVEGFGLATGVGDSVGCAVRWAMRL